MTLREFLSRSRTDRRAHVTRAAYDDARQMLRESKFTGETTTRWAEGVEKEILIDNPVVIQVER